MRPYGVPALLAASLAITSASGLALAAYGASGAIYRLTGPAQ
jgi:hypothetical protein